MSVRVEFCGVTAAYGDACVLRDFSLAVADGEFVALLGASGCGKTTALKVLAGLLAPARGSVRLDGADVTDVPAERRGAVMVFQSPLLFPFATVAENVAFGLKMRRLPKAEIQAKVAEALRWVRLEGYERRLPHELSGGQEQRVALARALATQPRVLLLDEPFSALDANLRRDMRLLVKTLHKRLGVTAIFVTHDQEEAVFMADRIAFMTDGRLDQVAPPREFFMAPKTAAAAQFFGWKTFAGTLADGVIRTAVGDFPASAVSQANESGTPADVLFAFHPHHVRLGATGRISEDDAVARLPVLIDSCVDLGRTARCVVRLAKADVEIEMETTTAFDPHRREATLEVPLNAATVIFR
jgi:putative spermidine/putrescine transport system ATP-binding protein